MKIRPVDLSSFAFSSLLAGFLLHINLVIVYDRTNVKTPGLLGVVDVQRVSYRFFSNCLLVARAKVSCLMRVYLPTRSPGCACPSESNQRPRETDCSWYIDVPLASIGEQASSSETRSQTCGKSSFFLLYTTAAVRGGEPPSFGTGILLGRRLVTYRTISDFACIRYGEYESCSSWMPAKAIHHIYILVKAAP